MLMKNFKRLFVGFIQGSTLMNLRLVMKAWKHVADTFIDKGVKSSAMIVRDEEDLPWGDVKERHERPTRAIFLLNMTKVGGRACAYAVNLIVVDIPEGIERRTCSRLGTRGLRGSTFQF
ncbi:hypothetical protein TrLO_g146 [Triparma laevis f. longispina]|uniref:Uncharacterized protein n=1 Tax=Triparma laevis f. longispina TaxID=1714387 RepID=A0A9W7F0R6_9STRA|nr:hypothetical protein TrLO_g146 [Triparma laevis f. longispina]